MAIIRGKRFIPQNHRLVTIDNKSEHYHLKKIIEYGKEKYRFLVPSFVFNGKLYISSVLIKNKTELDEEFLSFCLAKGILEQYQEDGFIDS
jgi:hypothetical protein